MLKVTQIMHKLQAIKKRSFSPPRRPSTRRKSKSFAPFLAPAPTSSPEAEVCTQNMSAVHKPAPSQPPPNQNPIWGRGTSGWVENDIFCDSSTKQKKLTDNLCVHTHRPERIMVPVLWGGRSLRRTRRTPCAIPDDLFFRPANRGKINTQSFASSTNFYYEN